MDIMFQLEEKFDIRLTLRSLEKIYDQLTPNN